MKTIKRFAALMILTITMITSVVPAMAASYDVKNGVIECHDFPKQNGAAYCTEYKVGETFYTYNKYGNNRTTGGGQYYVKIGKKYVYVAGAQCLAYARYMQEKLYGCNDGANSSKFKSVGSLSSGNMNEKNLKALIQKAGRGAHIRTGGRQHSFVILKVTDTAFTVADANGNGGSGKIAVKKYTYKDYVKSGWAKRGITAVTVKK